MEQPIWIATPKAIRWFNYCYSLPKVWWSSIKILAGMHTVGQIEKPLVMTCSISEDYARVWLYFAQKSLPREKWDFLIVDSSGAMDVMKFPGCCVIRFVNVYHGKKVDWLLRKLLQAENIFLCDDDKYILHDVSKQLEFLQDPQSPVISLSPRTWWYYRMNGQEYLPMGSYALMFKKSVFLHHNLHFQSPRHIISSSKHFRAGVKPQAHYDTADYANEQLLRLGYQVITQPDHESLSGFSGLSAPRILLIKYGKTFVKKALLEAKHYKEGSGNGSTMRAMYGIVKLEQLYRAIFAEEPVLSSHFSEQELWDILEQNSNLDESNREEIRTYFHSLEGISQKLLKAAP